MSGYGHFWVPCEIWGAVISDGNCFDDSGRIAGVLRNRLSDITRHCMNRYELSHLPYVPHSGVDIPQEPCVFSPAPAVSTLHDFVCLLNGGGNDEVSNLVPLTWMRLVTPALALGNLIFHLQLMDLPPLSCEISSYH